MTTEVEAKFHVGDLDRVAAVLKELGAEVLHPRILEHNWRYDTPEKDLEAHWRILRLRVSHNVVLTFKGRSVAVDGTSQRPEYQTEIGDVGQMRLLLEGLGYEVSGYYEKYRTEYRLEGMIVTLDEMPFGNFVEIEGQSVPEIQNLTTKLDLNWEANITDNYMVLFNRMKDVLGLEIEEISFAALEGVEATPEMWGLLRAD